MRVYPLAFVVFVSLLFAARGVAADEVELHSGAVFRGTVEKETDSEVVIRTDLGAMTFPKSDVKEVRRTGKAAPEAAGAGREARSFSIDGLDPSVRPVLLGDDLYAVRKDGLVAAWSLSSGKPRWTSEAGKGAVTGIAADPGGLYLLTSDGRVARLHPSTGELVWLVKPGGAFGGAPLLFRRRVYGFQPGSGLIGLETGNGSVHARLDLPVLPDTPLAAAGDSILLGTESGVLMSVGKDGTELAAALDTGRRWKGRDLAVRLRTVAVASGNRLLTRDGNTHETTRTVAVPGLASHPFAVDAGRAYVELDGALTALNLVDGRVVWRSLGVARVLAMAVDGPTLFVTTSDDTVAALALRNGKFRWSAPLGGRPASPPIPADGSALVVLADGRAALYAGTPGEPGAAGDAGAPAGSPTVLHSPDGYRVTAPEGWSLSEGVTRGRVSLGFRPLSGATRFEREGATERDRSLLEVSAYLSVVVLPPTPVSTEERVKVWLNDESLAARDANHEIGKTETGTKLLGGREWTRIRIQHVVGRDMLKGTFEKVALTTALSDGRIVWVEGKVPELYREAGAADVEALAASFAPETPSATEVPAHVAVAEAAVAALDRGDLKAFALHLSEPLRVRVSGETVKTGEVRFRLLTLSSAQGGNRRTVRVRIDRPSGTSYTGLTLAKEQGRWVIIDLGALVR